MFCLSIVRGDETSASKTKLFVIFRSALNELCK